MKNIVMSLNISTLRQTVFSRLFIMLFRNIRIFLIKFSRFMNLHYEKFDRNYRINHYTNFKLFVERHTY